MKVKIEQNCIFTDVDINVIPEFIHLSLNKIFLFFEEHHMVIPAKPFKWETWQDNPDTGIYVKAGRATSTTHDWIVEGYIRGLGHDDPQDFVFNHRMIIQNSWMNVKIEILVMLAEGRYEVYFDFILPKALEKPFADSLLAGS